jgi:hypothetical protein
MIARLLLALLILCGIPLADGARAQDGSSVYSVNRAGTNSGGPMQWLFGTRSNPHIIRVRPEARREAPARAYQPRRRTTYASRTAPAVDRPAPAPITQPAPNADAPPADDGSATPQTADTPAVPPAAPVAEPQRPPVQIAVIGDSLSIFLAQGLLDTYADRPNVSFIRRHREASGLVRDDYYDWPKQLRDLIATTPKLDAILVQLGSNDRQQLRDADGVHEPRSDRWRDLYAKRIDEIIAIAREKKIPLIWVGLPVMRGDRYSADMMAFNDSYRARTVQGGGTYVDIWEAFTGVEGAYAVNGPDVDGSIVRLRTADGVHFTKAGARKLAFFADKELKRIIAAVEGRMPVQPPAAIAVVPAAPAVPSGPALSIVLPALPEPALPAALKSTDALFGIPLPDPALPTALVGRPQQGPVLSLNKPPVTSGGALLPATSGTGDDLFRNGLPSAQKPGRADDFRFRAN